MSNAVQGAGVPRSVSRAPNATVDRPSKVMPYQREDRIFTRKTADATGVQKDGNFAKSFHQAQNLYQQFRRTFNPNYGFAPGESRSTFYTPKPELPPLNPSRYQAVVNAAIQANHGRSYQLPAMSGPAIYTRL